MRVHVTTHLSAHPDDVWNAVTTQQLLAYVIKPFGRFAPVDGELIGPWVEGTVYRGRSFMFSIIPVGTRTIEMRRVDKRMKAIETHEYGALGLKRWDHLISVRPEGDGTRYADTIEIDAGSLTVLYGCYAMLFYRHRQRRWRRLVRNDFRGI